MPTQYKGDTIEINLSETDETSGLPVSLDIYSNILIYLYVDTTVVAKYSRVEKTGYGPIDRISSTQYQAKVLSTTTKRLPVGNITMEVLVVTDVAKSIFQGTLCELLPTQIYQEV